MFTKSELIDLSVFLQEIIALYKQREERALGCLREDGGVAAWKHAANMYRENWERAEELKKQVMED